MTTKATYLQDRIHWSKLWIEMEKRDKAGMPIPFSLVYVKKRTGERRNYPICTLTSIHSKGSTLNIQLPDEDTPRTIRKCLIVGFNGKTVYQ